MLSVYEVFLAAATPIVKVVLIAVTGAFCATHRAGIITPEGVKSLSRIIVNLLVPCFLFTKLANALTIEKLGEWWIICGFVLLNNVCGMLVGCVIIAALPEAVGNHRRLVLATCALGNVGQIPLALADAACTDGLDKFSHRPGDCKMDSQAMVGFGISVGSLAVWTLAPILLRPPDVTAPAHPPSSDTGAAGDKALAYAQLQDDAAAHLSASELARDTRERERERKRESSFLRGDEDSHVEGDGRGEGDMRIHMGWPHNGPGVCPVCVRGKGGGGGKSGGWAAGSRDVYSSSGAMGKKECARTQHTEHVGETASAEDTESDDGVVKALPARDNTYGLLSPPLLSPSPSVERLGEGDDKKNVRGRANAYLGDGNEGGGDKGWSDGGLGNTRGNRGRVDKGHSVTEAMGEYRGGSCIEGWAKLLEAWANFNGIKLVYAWGICLYGLMSPPMIGALTGLFVGCTPALRALCISTGHQDAPLAVFTDAMSILSTAMIPCMLLLLGANMLPGKAEGEGVSKAEGGGWSKGERDKDAHMPPIVMICIVCTRLLVLPFMGILIMTGLRKAEVVSDDADPLVEFVALLQFSVPSAAQLNTIATLNGLKSKTLVSRLSLLQYSCATVTLTCYMMVYLVYDV